MTICAVISGCEYWEDIVDFSHVNTCGRIIVRFRDGAEVVIAAEVWKAA